jgi:cyclopropane-fatty-acyl-phospholipid synthase
MSQLKPFYHQVQAHYDLSNEFFALFLDRSMTYSCAYFERNDMTLEEAQAAKIDLSLSKCDLGAPLAKGRRLRLLDIGCGWGATALRAAERHRVDVTGLTLSRNQQAYARTLAKQLPAGAGTIDIRLQGWEEFNEPIDRIVSIGAFEHFRIERYPEFFARCRSLLPGDGRMMLHTIVLKGLDEQRELGLELDHETVLFTKFIGKHIFPGGQLCEPRIISERAQQAGFEVAKIQSLRLHYARTLDCWSANLLAAREQAIALTSGDTYDIYQRYLTGCADLFRKGYIDVVQFTLPVK